MKLREKKKLCLFPRNRGSSIKVEQVFSVPSSKIRYSTLGAIVMKISSTSLLAAAISPVHVESVRVELFLSDFLQVVDV